MHRRFICPLKTNKVYLIDQTNFLNKQGTVVYDYIKNSPFYTNTQDDMYIDEKVSIEIPGEDLKKN